MIGIFDSQKLSLLHPNPNTRQLRTCYRYGGYQVTESVACDEHGTYRLLSITPREDREPLRKSELDGLLSAMGFDYERPVQTWSVENPSGTSSDIRYYAQLL